MIKKLRNQNRKNFIRQAHLGERAYTYDLENTLDYYKENQGIFTKQNNGRIFKKSIRKSYPIHDL